MATRTLGVQTFHGVNALSEEGNGKNCVGRKTDSSWRISEQENKPWLEDLRQEQQKWGCSVCTMSYNGAHMHML